jgi:hypothetical protein
MPIIRFIRKLQRIIRHARIHRENVNETIDEIHHNEYENSHYTDSSSDDNLESIDSTET